MNLRTVLAILLTLAVAASAQQAKNEAPAPAPVPEQIAKAKTVFISNAGADGAGTIYSGGDERPYNQFCAGMKSWGRYKLTSAPAGSDLVFEFLANLGPTGVVGTQLRLRILDPSTHVVLWTLNVHVKPAAKRATSDKNFDDAMAQLVAAVGDLAARPVAAQ
jgi:hypothetical protein